MNINALIRQAHDIAVKNGFYEYENEIKNIGNRNISEMLMLIVSELAEAQEALRRNKFNPYLPEYTNKKLNIVKFKKYTKDTFEDEIADTFIRLADLCGYLNIDIEKFIIAKIEYNKTREKKHGKKF